VKIYNIHQKIKIEKGLVIGIGKFDGVHLGHQKLIKKIISISKRKNKIPAVFTFKNFPLESYITPFEEKISLLKKYGIEICIWSNFEEIKNWDGEKFIEFLIKIGVKEIVVGFNFKLVMYKLAHSEDINVTIAYPLKYKNKPYFSIGTSLEF